MGIRLTTYIGPYLDAPREFDYMPWDHLVQDGRCEADPNGDRWILIPNTPVAGITRDMVIDRHGGQEMAQITPALIARECGAFTRHCKPMLDYCEEHVVAIHGHWGVVPCWS